jgi:U2 small nuclear ribonucleoprotein A'
LKTLDFQKVRESEREEAEKRFGADDGAAQRAKTFTPGDGLDAPKDAPKKEVKQSGPTPEELTALKVAIANAETLEEVSRLENALKSGVVPSDLRI